MSLLKAPVSVSSPHPITEPAVLGMATTLTQSDPTTLSPNLAKSVSIKYDNSVQVMIAMGYGLTSKDGSDTLLCDYDKDPIFDLEQTKATKKRCKPTNRQLLQEVARRKEILGDKSKTGSQKGKMYYLDWLKKNPRTHPEDIVFLRHEIQHLKESISAASKQANVGSGAFQWRGEIPRLRLIHCILDCK